MEKKLNWEKNSRMCQLMWCGTYSANEISVFYDGNATTRGANCIKSCQAIDVAYIVFEFVTEKHE